MEPTLRDGQLIAVRYAAGARPGALVIVALPPDAKGNARPLAAKRLIHYEADGRAWIESDNQGASGRIDSWLVGPLPKASIVAVVVEPRLPQMFRWLNSGSAQ